MKEGDAMGKRENLTDRLNEYGMDEENLRGTNFAIHKNVMVWGENYHTAIQYFFHIPI